MPNETPPVAGPPPLPEQPKVVDKKDVAANDAYAQALLAVTTQNYEEHLAKRPQQRRLLTKKRIMILAISTIVGVVLTVAASYFLKGSSGSSGSPSTGGSKQLLHSVKTFDDPNAY